MIFMDCKVHEAVVIGPDKDSDEAYFIQVFAEDSWGFRPFPNLWGFQHTRRPVLTMKIERGGQLGTLTLFTSWWTIVDDRNSRGHWVLQLFDGEHLKEAGEWVYVEDDVATFERARRFMQFHDAPMRSVTNEELQGLIKGHWSPPWYVIDSAIRRLKRDVGRCLPRRTSGEELEQLARKCYSINFARERLTELTHDGVVYRIDKYHQDDNSPCWHPITDGKPEGTIIISDAMENGLFDAWLKRLEKIDAQQEVPANAS